MTKSFLMIDGYSLFSMRAGQYILHYPVLIAVCCVLCYYFDIPEKNGRRKGYADGT
jgi:hypothetical protein